MMVGPILTRRRSRPLRAAVVGAGVMGGWHARELARAGGSVVAIADLDPAAAHALAAAHRSARSSTDFDRLLAQTRPEVVHICTPTASHADLAERALQAGAHVLVEKPMASTSAATERLIGLAQSHGRLICPVHQYLFQPPLRSPARALARVGPIIDLSFTACSAGGVGATAADLDGVAADILPHALGVIHRLLPGGVEELRWSASAPRAGELRATATADQLGVSIRISMGGRPTCNELRLIGERGTLHLDFFHGFGFSETGAVSRVHKVARPFALGGSMMSAAAANLSRRALRREPAYPGLRELIAQLYAFVEGRSAPPIAPAESLAVARARERLLAQASQEGQARGSCSAA